ncbi:DoxX family protein [Acidithiobacillus ferriphilus]|uniref:DoxX family protein n=1 Tax=Acidithiobacillus ferriphilus TaxID=1689834 RepID=UPI001C076CAC|nr:DoxX family protein [Acidithiobacillus ferriphilus]MBU2853124.1 DoxX family protein [Acidithiobacillus ferriphilus]
MTTCSVAFNRMEKGYDRIVQWLSYLAPFADLAVRLWVARIFWLAGMAKLQSMTATVALFRYMYHVPLLPPVWAAYIGTGVEIVFPILLAFGLAGRFAAGFLFIYNIITVISYPQMGFSGMMDQVPWGIFLLVTIVYGPGVFSLDYGLNRIWKRMSHAVQKTV